MKMKTIYEDRMGNIHIWDKKCKDFQRAGLHHGMSECNGKEADYFIQMHSDQWKARNLTSQQIKDLDQGGLIFKKKLNDRDDRPSDYGEKEAIAVKGGYKYKVKK